MISGTVNRLDAVQVNGARTLVLGENGDRTSVHSRDSGKVTDSTGRGRLRAVTLDVVNLHATRLRLESAVHAVLTDRVGKVQGLRLVSHGSIVNQSPGYPQPFRKSLLGLPPRG